MIRVLKEIKKKDFLPKSDTLLTTFEDNPIKNFRRYADLPVRPAPATPNREPIRATPVVVPSIAAPVPPIMAPAPAATRGAASPPVRPCRRCNKCVCTYEIAIISLEILK